MALALHITAGTPSMFSHERHPLFGNAVTETKPVPLAPLATVEPIRHAVQRVSPPQADMQRSKRNAEEALLEQQQAKVARTVQPASTTPSPPVQGPLLAPPFLAASVCSQPAPISAAQQQGVAPPFQPLSSIVNLGFRPSIPFAPATSQPAAGVQPALSLPQLGPLPPHLAVHLLSNPSLLTAYVQQQQQQQQQQQLLLLQQQQQQQRQSQAQASTPPLAPHLPTTRPVPDAAAATALATLLGVKAPPTLNTTAPPPTAQPAGTASVRLPSLSAAAAAATTADVSPPPTAPSHLRRPRSARGRKPPTPLHHARLMLAVQQGELLNTFAQSSASALKNPVGRPRKYGVGVTPGAAASPQPAAVAALPLWLQGLVLPEGRLLLQQLRQQMERQEVEQQQQKQQPHRLQNINGSWGRKAALQQQQQQPMQTHRRKSAPARSAV